MFMKDLQTLKSHINTIHIDPVTPLNSTDGIEVLKEDIFQCDKCLYEGTTSDLERHSRNKHSSNLRFNCDRCSLTFISKDKLKDHVLDNHEESVMMHTMASQIDQLHSIVPEIDVFKTDLTDILQKRFDNQNILKQELFLIKNNLATRANDCLLYTSDAADE